LRLTDDGEVIKHGVDDFLIVLMARIPEHEIERHVFG